MSDTAGKTITCKAAVAWAATEPLSTSDCAALIKRTCSRGCVGCRRLWTVRWRSCARGSRWMLWLAVVCFWRLAEIEYIDVAPPAAYVCRSRLPQYMSSPCVHFVAAAAPSTCAAAVRVCGNALRLLDRRNTWRGFAVCKLCVCVEAGDASRLLWQGRGARARAVHGCVPHRCVHAERG